MAIIGYGKRVKNLGFETDREKNAKAETTFNKENDSFAYSIGDDIDYQI